MYVFLSQAGWILHLKTKKPLTSSQHIIWHEFCKLKTTILSQDSLFSLLLVLLLVGFSQSRTGGFDQGPGLWFFLVRNPLSATCSLWVEGICWNLWQMESKGCMWWSSLVSSSCIGSVGGGVEWVGMMQPYFSHGLYFVSSCLSDQLVLEWWCFRVKTVNFGLQRDFLYLRQVVLIFILIYLCRQ